MLDDHTPPGLNTITVLRWQYGGPRTQEFAAGPTGQVLQYNALDQLGGVQVANQAGGSSAVHTGEVRCATTVHSGRSALISSLKVEQVQHSRSVKSMALPCTLL